MGTHPIFESDFDCLTDSQMSDIVEEEVNEEMEVVEEAEVEDANAVSSDSNKSESEEEEYEGERIVATRFVKKKQQYLVKWVNYDEHVSTGSNNKLMPSRRQ